ncbi:MAG TPA: hypothetical protein VGM90_32555 [Kofleriaceae bacterium]|jgi:hypothetical protein
MLETLIRRLDLVRISAAALALSAAGCTGFIDVYGGPGDPTMDDRAADKAWIEKAYPVLSGNCTMGCHGSDVAAGTFLAGAAQEDVRATLVGYDPAVVNLEEPRSSRILNKGLHKGPEMSSQQASDVLEWLLAEQSALPQPGQPGGGVILRTTAIDIQKCPAGTPVPSCPINTIDLSTVPGAMLDGATITFKAPDLGGDLLYLNEVTLNPGTSGINLEHPLFVSRPADFTAAGAVEAADPIDRYYALKLNLAAGTPQPLEGGTATFVGFPATNQLEIHFKVIAPFKPEDPATGGTTTAGGCKDLASFKTNVVTPMQTNCGSCHNGGNANAKSAMDLTGINTADDTMIATACGQVLSRANLVAPDSSSIFVAPDPANNNHPFKFQAAQLTTFKTSVTTWINAEKVAP